MAAPLLAVVAVARPGAVTGLTAYNIGRAIGSLGSAPTIPMLGSRHPLVLQAGLAAVVTFALQSADTAKRPMDRGRRLGNARTVDESGPIEHVRGLSDRRVSIRYGVGIGRRRAQFDQQLVHWCNRHRHWLFRLFHVAGVRRDGVAILLATRRLEP